ncbi:MAG: hypothetical protein H3C55_07005 [Pseudorhodoplanes sp.]|nr:hypothetical protein [Pseudorhodoplanes sp.]
MHLRIAAAMAAVFVTVSPLAAEPQRFAQIYGGEALPPYEVVTIVRSMGLDPLHRPVWRGGQYVFRALDRHGEEVRVVVDGYRGRVLSVTPTAALGGDVRPQRAPYPPVPGADEDDYEDDYPPEQYGNLHGDLLPRDPPPVITGPRSSATPPRSAALDRGNPPLPRAKPALPAEPDAGAAAPNEKAATRQVVPPPVPQGPVRRIELYKKPQEPAPDSKPPDVPVQPLDDTPSVQPNL